MQAGASADPDAGANRVEGVASERHLVSVPRGPVRPDPLHAKHAYWHKVVAMARLDIPAGEGGDAVQIWSLQPELGAAATRFVHAAYNKSILPTRVREAARMRIAQLNDCTVCLGFRAER